MDLDLGNYERYLDVTLSRDNNITTGKIYREVIEKEVRSFLEPVFSKLPTEGVVAKRRISGKDGAGTVFFFVCRRISFLVELPMPHHAKIVPHVTDAIQDWIQRVSKIPVDDTGEEPDMCIVEVRNSVCVFSLTFFFHKFAAAHSSEAPWAISNPLPSSRLCANSSSASATKTLL